MSFIQDVITKILIYVNIGLIVFSGLHLDKWWSHPVLDYLIAHIFAVFIISFFLIICIFKGGGILGLTHRIVGR